jgi:hypothetical protein
VGGNVRKRLRTVEYGWRMLELDTGDHKWMFVVENGWLNSRTGGCGWKRIVVVGYDSETGFSVAGEW